MSALAVGLVAAVSSPASATAEAFAEGPGWGASPVPVGAVAVAPERGADSLQATTDGMVTTGGVGATVTVDDGRHQQAVSAGLAVRDPARPMRSTDQVEIGSNTKTFMATIALQLVAERRLALSDPVDRWLPGIVPNGGVITVRMLLNHTSGIFNYAEDEAWVQEALTHPDRVWQPAELVAVAAAHPTYFPPGTGWQYSNTNYILVGMILNTVTGTDPVKLVARRIAAPLGLVHTYLPVPGQNTDGPHRAHSHTVLFNVDGTRTYTDVTTPRNLSWAGTAGAMISTTGDLSRFFQALLGGRLLPPAQLAQMRTTVPIVPPGQPNPQHAAYGLGLVTADTPCGTVWGHGGDTIGTATRDWFTTDGTRSSVAAINTKPDLRQDSSVPAFGKFTQAEGALVEQMVCQMFGKPVPTPSTAVTRSFAPTPMDFPWRDLTGLNAPHNRRN